MPLVADKIRVNLITELSGVAMNSTLYFEIEDLGDDDPVVTNLAKLATAYHAVVEDVCTTQWAVTCITYFNETTTEPKEVLPITLAGAVITDAHPQASVVRYNRYGLYTGDGTTRRGAHNLSGVAEAFSTSGRLNDATEFLALGVLLSSPIVLADGGWHLVNQLKITPDPTFPLIKDFILSTKCQPNGVFQVLASRKTRLCGTT